MLVFLLVERTCKPAPPVVAGDAGKIAGRVGLVPEKFYLQEADRRRFVVANRERNRAIVARLGLAWPVTLELKPFRLGQEAVDSYYFREPSAEPAMEIQLTTAQGRFELLVLALLHAARVREHIAEGTFLELRRRGLLELARLARWAPEDLAGMGEVFQVHYRALADKNRKVEAIFHNARILCDCFAGDLEKACSPGKVAPEATIHALQAFWQIKDKAYWICREMRRHGVWRDLDPAACHAVDLHVKLALWRLGFVGWDASHLGEVSSRDCQEALKRYFVDSLPVYLQGSRLCSRWNPSLCRRSCQVIDFCRWRGPINT